MCSLLSNNPDDIVGTLVGFFFPVPMCCLFFTTVKPDFSTNTWWLKKWYGGFERLLCLWIKSFLFAGFNPFIAEHSNSISDGLPLKWNHLLLLKREIFNCWFPGNIPPFYNKCCFVIRKKRKLIIKAALPRDRKQKLRKGQLIISTGYWTGKNKGAGAQGWSY